MRILSKSITEEKASTQEQRYFFIPEKIGKMPMWSDGESGPFKMQIFFYSLSLSFSLFLCLPGYHTFHHICRAAILITSIQ